MARRSPGEIRAQLRRRHTSSYSRHRRIPVIRGLSASANRQIAAFERSRRLPAGEVAGAFRIWSGPIRRPRRPTDTLPVFTAATLDLDNHHVRTLLEFAMRAVRTKARRELAALLAPADERRLRHTLNDPFAARHLPWWLRRFSG